MGVEVMGGDVTPVVPVKDVKKGDIVLEKENGAVVDEPITFGSHGTDIPSKEEVVPVKDTNLPKDAVDEWPAPKQIHSFYFVKVRPFDDPKLKARIEAADKELHKKNQARYQMTEAIKAKRAERSNVISQLRPLTDEDKRYRMIVGEKRKEMEPLQQALGKLRSSNNAGRERGSVGICSSEEELNDMIYSLNYRIQHESNTLVEEKQLLREIKQLEGSRDKVIAHAAMKAKIQDSLGQKEDIQDQVKLIGGDLDGVRKEQQAIRAKISNLEVDLKAIDSEIATLQEDLTALSESRDKAFEHLVELRKQREGGNSSFYQNRSLLNNARELAAKKNITALDELSAEEVEKFMSLWSSTKTFRDDYEKRILTSLDQRQLSRDGRMRNPDEKPLVVIEAPKPAEPAPVLKANIKKSKEETKAPPPQIEQLPVKKVPKEDNKKSTAASTTSKTEDPVKEEDVFVPEKPQKEKTAAEKAINEAKLKEIKREEEIAKAKLALDRKKKLAEKTAAKAAVRAQKEAEKKLKEREKRSKKKAGGSGVALDSEEQTEVENSETVESETADVATTEASVPLKKNEQKDRTIRPRTRTRGGQDPLPRAILKRKKSTTNYWIWAVPAALVILILIVLGYYYLL